MNGQNRLFILSIVLLIISAVYLLAPILSPFLTGILFAYLANPVVNLLMRTGLSRMVAVIIVFTLFFTSFLLILIALIPFIEQQIMQLISSIPAMIAWLQTSALPWLSSNMHIDTQAVNIDSLRQLILSNWTKAGGISLSIMQSMFTSGTRAISWVLNLLLIPVVTFYFLCDWQMILRNIQSLIPARIRPTVITLSTECNSVVSEFLRGQLIVMLCLGVLYSIGLSIIGIQMGLLIGIVAGLLCIIPYLGFIIGIAAASLAAFFQYGDITHIGLVILVFITAQAIDGVFLTPKLVGHRIGLHPVAVIFSILAGSYLFGFAGALLALPTAAVIMVWARHWHQQFA